MNNLTKPKARDSQILIQELGDEVLIYDLKINKAFSLNETCAMVWTECNGVKSIDQITQKLSLETKGLVNHEVVWLALESLKKENLLDDGVEIPKLFDGLNRREVIRKVGFASLVALPIITSLVAPMAANAATCSLVQPGQQFATTTRPATCADGTCPTICSNQSNLCCSNSIRSVVCTDLGGVPPSIQCDCTCN